MANDGGGGTIMRTGIVLDTSQIPVGASEAIAAIRGVGTAAAETSVQMQGAMNTAVPTETATATRQVADAYSAVAIQARAAAQGIQLSAEQAQIMAARVQTIKAAYQQAFPGFGSPTGGMAGMASAGMGELQAMALEMDAVQSTAAKMTGGAAAAVPGFFEQLAGHAGNAAVGMSYLRRELVSSAAQMTNTSPIVDRLAYTLTALSGPGMGTIAIGMIAAVAAIGGVVKIWEHLNATQIDNQKALEKWQQSAAGMAAQADADRASLAALNGTSAEGTVIVHGQTAAQEELRRSFAATMADLLHGTTILGQLKTAWEGFTMQGSAGDRLQFLQFSTQLNTIETAFANGHLTVDQYRNSLDILAQSYKKLDIGPEIQQAELYASDLQGLRKSQAELNAETVRTQALDAERAASLATAAGLAAQRLAAAKAGGKDAVQRIDDEQQALQKATPIWEAYVKTQGDATLARMTLTQAVTTGNAYATEQYNLALRAVTLNHQTTDVLNQQKDAQQAANDELKRAMDLGLKDIDAYQKWEAAGRKLTASVTAHVAALQAETADLNRENAVVGQSQQVRDAVTVSIAGETAVRQLLAEAMTLGRVATQKEINDTRAAAEAHERASLALQEHKQAVAAATKETTAAYKAEARELQQTARDIANSMSSTVSSFFSNVLTKGTNIWQQLMDTLERSFAQLISRLAAQDIMGKILGNATSGFSPSAAASMMGIGGIVPGAATSGAGASFGAGLGVGLGALGVGYGVGSQTTNSALGGLGGAASGAAAGAMLGSVVPGIGTAVGAVIGGIAGLVGGLFGSAAKAREAAAQMKLAQDAFQTSLQGMIYTVTDNTLGASIAQAQAQFLQLQDQARKAYKGDDLESALNQLSWLESSRIAQLQAEFNEQQAQAQASLRVRQLQAQAAMASGAQATALTQEAAAADLAAKQEAELAQARKNGDNAATIALLQQTQAMETAALQVQQANANAAKAFSDQQAADQLRVRLLTAQGNTEAANALALHLQQQKEWNDAVTQGQSAQYLAALQLTQAAETAKAAADAAAKSQQDALSQLQQQFTVFGTTASDQLTAIASLYGFTGMTLSDIQALYTKYAPGQTLTAQQVQENAAIAEYVKDYTAAGGKTGTASAVANATQGRSSVSTAATTISIAQGDLMAGLLTSANVWLAQIAANTSVLRQGPTNIPAVGATLDLMLQARGSNLRAGSGLARSA